MLKKLIIVDFIMLSLSFYNLYSNILETINGGENHDPYGPNHPFLNSSNYFMSRFGQSNAANLVVLILFFRPHWNVYRYLEALKQSELEKHNLIKLLNQESLRSSEIGKSQNEDDENSESLLDSSF
jgi:hypothetical protein